MTHDEAEELALSLLEQGLISAYECRPSYPAPRKLSEVTSWDVAVQDAIQGWITLRSLPIVGIYQDSRDGEETP